MSLRDFDRCFATIKIPNRIMRGRLIWIIYIIIINIILSDWLARMWKMTKREIRFERTLSPSSFVSAVFSQLLTVVASPVLPNRLSIFING